MSTPKAAVGMSETHAQLQRDAIGLPRVIAFTGAFIGPAASIALGLVAAFSFAGFATPFVVLLAFLGALFASNSVSQMAQRLPSAGGLYTYNAVSLGRPAGFVTGWMMAFAYILWVPAASEPPEPSSRSSSTMRSAGRSTRTSCSWSRSP